MDIYIYICDREKPTLVSFALEMWHAVQTTSKLSSQREKSFEVV